MSYHKRKWGCETPERGKASDCQEKKMGEVKTKGETGKQHKTQAKLEACLSPERGSRQPSRGEDGQTHFCIAIFTLTYNEGKAVVSIFSSFKLI